MFWIKIRIQFFRVIIWRQWFKIKIILVHFHSVVLHQKLLILTFIFKFVMEKMMVYSFVLHWSIIFLQSISKAFSISIPRFIIENNYAFLFTDDPYYCGLRARIPNFVKSRKKKLEEKAKKDAQSSPAQAQLQAHPGQQRILPAPTLNSMSGVQGGVTSTNPLWWHSRLYSDLGPLGSMMSILIHYFTLHRCLKPLFCGKFSAKSMHNVPITGPSVL